MQADGSADPGERPDGDQDAACQDVVWPSALEPLLQRHDFHPDARAALARLQQADIDRLWGEAQVEVAAWPSALRSEHDVAACFIGWAMASWQSHPDHDELAGQVRLEGEGIRARVCVLDSRDRWEAESVPSLTQGVLRRMAQQALRQALAPTIYRRLPYCTPELLHPEREYPGMAEGEVAEWIKTRRDRMRFQAEERLRVRMLRDARSLGALQGASRAPELQAEISATLAREPALGEALLDLSRKAPVLMHYQLCVNKPLVLSNCRPLGWKDRSEELISDAQAVLKTRLGGRLMRDHGTPMTTSRLEDWGLKGEVWLRAMLIEAGVAVQNAFSARGGANVRRVLNHWFKIPGAKELSKRHDFALGPIFAGMRDCEAEQFEVLGNSLGDAIRWTCCDLSQERTNALLAMSLRDLHRYSADIHERMRELVAASRLPGDDVELEPVFGERTVEGYDLVELRSAKALREEGDRLRHCVAGHWGRVAFGACTIISVRRKGKRIATCEVALKKGEYVIVELSGLENRPPPQTVRDVMDRVVTRINRGEIAISRTSLQRADGLHLKATGTPAPHLEAAWVNERLGPWMERPPLALRRRRRETAAD